MISSRLIPLSSGVPVLHPHEQTADQPPIVCCTLTSCSSAFTTNTPLLVLSENQPPLIINVSHVVLCNCGRLAAGQPDAEPVATGRYPTQRPWR